MIALPSKQVIVVGAGPTGLLLALILARAGISITVLEANKKIDDRPRACLYGPAASQVIRRAGIMHKILERGFYVRAMAWRKPGGEKIVKIDDMDSLNMPDKMISYPLNLLGEVILEELMGLDNVSIHWNHRVIGLSQDENRVSVEVEYLGHQCTIVADFVVGCDGASSGVRKALLGRDFSGYTLDTQMVTTNVYYDFDRYGWSDLQWTIDPKHWFISMRISKEGLWRVAYGENAQFSEEQLRERLPDKFRTMLPGNPGPDQYQINNMAVFRMHQRCVSKMREGRVLLAGDAAHLCNPMGGLGLTGGIADVGSLSDCLLGIYSGKAELEILDKYDEVRRGIYRDIIDPLSTMNMKRMSQDAETVLENDTFLQFVASAGKDPELTAKMFERDLTLVSDMTQCYKTEENEISSARLQEHL